MKEENEPKTVVLYIRVSSDEQKKKGLSMEAQEKRLLGYVDYMGWKVHAIYRDEGVSGKSISGRKDFKAMLKNAPSGDFSGLLVTKYDRASRSVPDGYFILNKLNELGIDFISLSESFDLDTATGRGMFGMAMVFAQMEAEMTGDRVRDIHQDKFNRGIMVGKPPFGYYWKDCGKDKPKELVIDSKKAEMVRNVFSMASRGVVGKEICASQGINPQTYYNILKNKTYIGIITYKGKEKLGTHEPLIKKELWEKVNR